MKKLKEYFQRYKNEAICLLIVLYIIVLGFGVVGEIFNIKWILDLPVFRI
jgi:hypothetical protein